MGKVETRKDVRGVRRRVRMLRGASRSRIFPASARRGSASWPRPGSKRRSISFSTFRSATRTARASRRSRRSCRRDPRRRSKARSSRRASSGRGAAASRSSRRSSTTARALSASSSSTSPTSKGGCFRRRSSGFMGSQPRLRVSGAASSWRTRRLKSSWKVRRAGARILFRSAASCPSIASCRG